MNLLEINRMIADCLVRKRAKYPAKGKKKFDDKDPMFKLMQDQFGN